MVDDIKGFWIRLLTSQILSESDCQTWKRAVEAAPCDVKSDPQNLADWLSQKKAISPFQANILLAGRSGPFRFGNYLIIQPLDEGAPGNQFQGLHRLTGHPVLLHFFGGSIAEALNRWTAVQRLAEGLNELRHPNLMRVYEAVAIPEYRFVVTEPVRGTRMDERIPLKSRISSRDAEAVIAQLAAALQLIHSHGWYHGQVWPALIRLEKGSRVQLAFPSCLPQPGFFGEDTFAGDIDVKSAQTRDVRNLAAIWCRLVTGSLPFSPDREGEVRDDILPRLERCGVASSSANLMARMLSAEESDQTEFESWLSACGQKGQQSETESSHRVPVTQEAFEDWLSRSPTDFFADRDLRVATDEFASLLRPTGSDVAEMELVDLAPTSEWRPIESSAGVDRTPVKRGRGRRHTIGMVLGSLLAVAAVIVIVVTATMNQPNTVAIKPAGVESGTGEDALPEAESLSAEIDSPLPANDSRDNHAVTERQPAQILVADDGQLLWESPTAGGGIKLEYIPPAPRIIVSSRAAALLAKDEGRRLQRALGPTLNRRFDEWQNQAGVSLSEVEQLLVSLHSNQEFAYDVFARIDLATPTDQTALLSNWQDTELIAHPAGTEFYCRSENECLAITSVRENMVNQFILGPRWLIEASLDTAGAMAVFGPMERLAERSDDQRHLSILFLRSGLFGDEGQKLMSPSLANWNRELALILDQDIPAANLSLHLDSGTYLELNFDRTVDLQPEALRERLPRMFDRLRQLLQLHADSLKSFEYWQPLGGRYEAMMSAFSQQWRTGIEDKQVIANCWLPPTALHNLVAAAECLMSFAHQGPQTAGRPATPKNLRELLQTARDLSVSTRPDLIILIRNLEQEIRDDYGQLPFEFEIRLMGNDLAKEGITQNQRPGDFELRQAPLSDILSEIMVQANPDRNITGPSDPRCKMVWVIANDPADPNRELILITTRAAAAEKSYELPAAFRTN